MFSRARRLIIGGILLLFLLVIHFIKIEHHTIISLILVIAIGFIIAIEMLSVTQDQVKIIEKKPFESKNRISQENFLESIPLPSAVINHKEEIIAQNNGFRHLVNQNTNSIKTLEFQLRKILNEAIMTRRPLKREVQIDQYEYQLNASPILVENMRLILVVFLDITQLAESQRNQRRFIADASHELKTPITALRGMSEILNRKDVDAKTKEEFTIQIEKQVLRLQHLVNDLLSISKLSSNRVILNYSSFNFADLIGDVYYSLKQKFIDKNLTFICDFNDVHVWLDYSRMQQIMSNLMSNAVAYTDEGHVKVSYWIENNSLNIKVDDTGIGIDSEHLKYIFDRFYRIDQARLRDEGGSGLGLSIVKELVSAHQGDLVVDSVVGEGTSFTIIIPINELTQN